MHLTVLSLEKLSPSRSIVDQAHYTFRSALGPHHTIGLFPPAIRLGSQGCEFFIARNSPDRVDFVSTCSRSRTASDVPLLPELSCARSVMPDARAPDTIWD